MKKIAYIILALIVLAAISVSVIWKLNRDSKFKAPGTSWSSEKEVSDYFVEKLGMSPEEARNGSSKGVDFRVSKDTTFESILGNLAYYGLVRDKAALKSALEQTKDTTSGKENAIRIGNGSIDINASYILAKEMTAWEVADVLLNKPKYWDLSSEPYSYIFMPIKP